MARSPDRPTLFQDVPHHPEFGFLDILQSRWMRRPSEGCRECGSAEFSEPTGSWKTILHLPRICFRRRTRASRDPRQRRERSPDVGRTSPTTARPKRGFAEPDSPTNPIVSPGIEMKLTWSTARTSPVWRCKTPGRSGSGRNERDHSSSSSGREEVQTSRDTGGRRSEVPRFGQTASMTARCPAPRKSAAPRSQAWKA